MLIYNERLENDLTQALHLSHQLQLETIIPIQDTLEDRMLYLSTYANWEHIDNTVCVLGNDFADYSFSFGIYMRTQEALPHFTLEYIDQFTRDNPDISSHVFLSTNGYRQWLVGGLIYHGSKGRTTSNLTVSLSSCGGWSVHT